MLHVFGLLFLYPQDVYADVKCNLKVKFRKNEESFFTSMQELEDILDKCVSFLIGCVDFITFMPSLLMLGVYY